METPPTINKLTKLIPLLGSPIDGEVVAAARAIERVLKNDGLDWHEFVKLIFSVTETAPAKDHGPSTREYVEDNWRKLVDALSNMPLSRKESDFVSRMSRWYGDPTERQMNWLLDLKKKYRI